MKKSFWQSSVFRFWLVCYLLVLGIPMIFSAVAQHRIFEDLKKRTYDQSVSAVEQLASTVWIGTVSHCIRSNVWIA